MNNMPFFLSITGSNFSRLGSEDTKCDTTQKRSIKINLNTHLEEIIDNHSMLYQKLSLHYNKLFFP